MTPKTLTDGLLSGLAHPVIGLDHLMFLIGAGVLLGLTVLGMRKLAVLALAFVVAGAPGTLIRAGGLSQGGVEVAVAASLLIVGAGLWWQRIPQTASLVVLAALGGVIHGYAFGEAVIGAEPTPLGAYLAGLAAMQLGLLVASFGAARMAVAKTSPSALRRATNALCACVTLLGSWGVAIHAWS